MNSQNPTQIHATGEATGFIPAPGVTYLVLNPDAHAGYGAPVGCVLTSPTHIYPSPVGVDIKCSMSFLQLDLPADQVADKTVRRALIDAILERTPTGPGRGQRSARKARKVADRALDQKTGDDEFVAHDILSNCRLYPKDEARAAYKDFGAVLDSVKAAGLASEVARLKARWRTLDLECGARPLGRRDPGAGLLRRQPTPLGSGPGVARR